MSIFIVIRIKYIHLTYQQYLINLIKNTQPITIPKSHFTMNPQQQIASLTQKLQASQAQFQNYKIQCKQLESFLQEESAHKQAEIRQLKEEAIKREKIIASLKNQLSLAQSDNKNLKTTITQLQSKLSSISISASPPVSSSVPSIASTVLPVPPSSTSVLVKEQNQISQQNYEKALYKVSELYKQIQNMEYNMSNQTNRSKIVIGQLKQQNFNMKNKIQQLIAQNQRLKKQNTAMRSQIQAVKQQQQANKNNSSNNTNNSKSGIRTVQIKIQKTKQISAPLSSRSKDSKGSNNHYNNNNDHSSEQIQRLKSVIAKKNQQIQGLNQKIAKILDKVVKYQRRIKQLQHLVSSAHQISYDEEQQSDSRFINHRQLQKQKYESLDNQKSPKPFKPTLTHTQNPPTSKYLAKNQNLLTPHKSALTQSFRPTTSVLILTKKYYNSSFLDLPPNVSKNTLKLYKTDKNGKIDRTMGSILYKVDSISYNIEQIVTTAVQNINKNMRNNCRSRIVIYGVRKSYKKIIMIEIINRLRNLLQHIVQQSITNQNQTQHKNGNNNENNVGVCYLELEDQFVKNVQMAGNTQQEIVDILDFIARLNQEQPRTPKKHQKGQVYGNNLNSNKKKVRYFSFDCGVRSIQIITSDFIDANIKQQQGLNAALQRIAYSKIPIIVNSIQQQDNPSSWQTHIILTLNPIVNLYEQCKNTLIFSNFKRGLGKSYSSSMNMTLRNGSSEHKQYQSPPRIQNNSSINLYKSNILAQREQETGLEQNVRISKMQQKIQFYRTKLNQLLIQLKVILNANNGNISYLKKSQNILNYEKIQRFVQSIINQGQQTEYFSPSRKSYMIANLEQLQISP